MVHIYVAKMFHKRIIIFERPNAIMHYLQPIICWPFISLLMLLICEGVNFDYNCFLSHFLQLILILEYYSQNVSTHCWTSQYTCTSVVLLKFIVVCMKMICILYYSCDHTRWYPKTKFRFHPIISPLLLRYSLRAKEKQNNCFIADAIIPRLWITEIQRLIVFVAF